MAPRPSSVRLRTYQVGFGDALLLTITYGSRLPDRRRERHVLIDLGSRVYREGGPVMADIAAKIAEHCGGHLDAVVATHRHQDHVKGFGDTGAESHLDQLHPKLIVRPWTDVPERKRADPALGLDQQSQDFMSTLDEVNREAAAVQERFAVDRSKVAKRAKALAELGIPNGRAVARLEAWATDAQPAWVKAGDTLDTDLLPGVHLQVLGPPTLSQVPGLRSYASASAEYWLALAAAGDVAPLITPPSADALVDALDKVAAPGGVGAAEWLLRRLHGVGSRQVLDIVEGFDDVLNNTSIVLLVTVGKRSILLAGDAQVENWSYALDCALGKNGRRLDEALRRQLANVDVYKVGHHGSRNATPKSLYRLWTSTERTKHPLTSVLSTKEGVYDKTTEGAVPDPDLLGALRGLGPLYNTDDLADGVWWFDVQAPTSGKASFTYAAGPRIGGHEPTVVAAVTPTAASTISVTPVPGR